MFKKSISEQGLGVSVRVAEESTDSEVLMERVEAIVVHTGIIKGGEDNLAVPTGQWRSTPMHPSLPFHSLYLSLLPSAIEFAWALYLFFFSVSFP